MKRAELVRPRWIDDDDDEDEDVLLPEVVDYVLNFVEKATTSARMRSATAENSLKLKR